jgi:hypothetical protein
VQVCFAITSDDPELSLTKYAGLSPFLTTFEVFTVPSRIGRLLLGMRQFAVFDIDGLWYGFNLMAKSWIPEHMWPLRKDTVQPALQGGWFLAPTTKQRLTYTKYLCVWGKEKVHVPNKLKIALNEFNVCLLLFSTQLAALITNHSRAWLERRWNSRIECGFVKVDLSMTHFIHISSLRHFRTSHG